MCDPNPYRPSARKCPQCGEECLVREYTQPALVSGRADCEMFDCQTCGYTMDIDTMDAADQPVEGYRSIYTPEGCCHVCE